MLPVNTDGFGAHKTSRTEACVDIFGKYDHLHEPRKTPEEVLAICHGGLVNRLYTGVTHVKKAGSMARAYPYSRKITHYASIMPSAAKHVYIIPVIMPA